MAVSMNGFEEHWQKVNTGATVINSTPQQFWNNAIEYFKWNDSHPIKAKRTLQSGKEAGKQVEVEFKRPYSLKALCLHCNINEKWINDITQTNAKDSEWYIIVERVMMIIYSQNLEGALVELFNPIIVSKLLSLDKQDSSENHTVRVEIVSADTPKLANSENEILQKLDFGKVEILKSQVENLDKKQDQKKQDDLPMYE